MEPSAKRQAKAGSLAAAATSGSAVRFNTPAALPGVFSGCRVLVGLRLCRAAQENVVKRGGGATVPSAAEATHLVLETSRDPATHPALAGIPVESWPQLRTEHWVSECTKQAKLSATARGETARRALLETEMHPRALPSPEAQGAADAERREVEPKSCMPGSAAYAGGSGAVSGGQYVGPASTAGVGGGASGGALVCCGGCIDRVDTARCESNISGGSAFQRVALASEQASAGEAADDSDLDEEAALPEIAEARGVTPRDIVLEEFNTLAASYTAAGRAARGGGAGARQYHYMQVSKTIESQLPDYFTASDIRAMSRLHGVGTETAAKLREIYATGALRRAGVMRDDPTQQARRELTGLWGVGSARAEELIGKGVTSVQQLSSRPDLTSEGTKAFLAHYDDLMQPVPRDEIVQHEERVRRVALAVDPRIRVQATGSFRRGDASCKDVDMLLWYAGEEAMRGALVPRGVGQILGADGADGGAHGGCEDSSVTSDDRRRDRGDGDTDHEQEGAHRRLLGRVLPALVEDGYIVHSLTSGYAATQDGSALGGGRKELREEDENWDSPHTLYMGICRLDAAHPYRRIDLKAANNATLPYAFICFTGSAQFNRFLNRFAKQLGLHFSPNGMYPRPSKGPSTRSREFGGTNGKRGGGRPPGTRIVPAETEADVFAALGLCYVAPEWRRDKNDVVKLDGTPAFPDTDSGRAPAGNATLALMGPT